jgi:hypothetical protein
MADEEVPEELKADNQEYLPYDTDFLYTCCSAYATLIEVDKGLLSKPDAKKLTIALDKLMEVIVASSDKVHSDYFSE